MPEGHTIHRLARDLNKDLAGHDVTASSPQGRFAAGAARLHGEKMVKVDAWGKHLFCGFASGQVLHIHLGLIGKFRRKKLPAPEPTDTVRLRLVGDVAAWDLTGPYLCAVITDDDRQEVTAKLGPDPLRATGVRAVAAAREDFGARLARRRVAIGAALLDQKIIAGIGNVYRAEILFLLGIDPRRPANSLDEAEVNAIWDLTSVQLGQGVRLNRIVTVDPAEAGVKSAGRLKRADALYAYKREGLPCRRCGTEIEIMKIANRSMWACPTCQK